MDSFVSVGEFEKRALQVLPQNARDYYRSGATSEQTLQENKAAFRRLRIRPKCLRNVSSIDMSTTILGSKIDIPVGIAPTAMQRMAHPDGEEATVKAAGTFNTIHVLSTIATTSIEDVAKASPTTIKWYQLYVYKDRNITRELVARAERSGFKAIVLTVDTPIMGLRRVDMKNKFNLPPPLRLANFDGAMSDMSKAQAGSGLTEYVVKLFDPSLSWEDVKWLKSITKLPIVVKGILRGDDAKIAAEAGVAGILVSNHGARQVDGVPATIEVLSEVVAAIKDTNVEVYLDGGVNEGTDVFKALALGAKMVFIGRPALWGLANGGQKGVERVLDILKMELNYALMIGGCRKCSEITTDMVAHESSYYSRL